MQFPVDFRNAGGEAVGDILRRGSDLLRDLIAGQRQFSDDLSELGAQRIEALENIGAANAKIIGQRFAGRLQFPIDLRNAGGEAVGDILRRGSDLLRDLVASQRQFSDDLRALVRQNLFYSVAGALQRDFDFLTFGA